MIDPKSSPPIAVEATAVPPRRGAVFVPEPFRSRLAGRVKHPLGDAFGLTAFGVNLLRLAPGDVSSLHHRHTAQDELVYVVAGHPTVVTDDGEVTLSPGMCAGFRAGGPAHHLENRAAEEALLLEVGDRATGDDVVFPREDLVMVTGADGKRRFTHRDGTPY